MAFAYRRATESYPIHQPVVQVTESTSVQAAWADAVVLVSATANSTLTIPAGLPGMEFHVLTVNDLVIDGSAVNLFNPGGNIAGGSGSHFMHVHYNGVEQWWIHGGISAD